MLKLLLKKQMSEVFRSYFVNAKKNTRRSKAGIAGMFVFFAVVMVGVLGGMFTFLSVQLCEPFSQADVGWLYFLIMGMLALVLGIFGSVFNTYSQLYLAKDNDLLLSMPIPLKDIILSRLIGVYLLGVMYSAVVIIPAVIVYWVIAGASVPVVIGGIILTLLIFAIVMLLSVLLGWCVARISIKLKRKSFVTVLLSLVFIGVYYFAYFKAMDLIQKLIENAVIYGEKVKGGAYILYLFGRVGEGDPAAVLVWVVITAVLCAAAWLLLKKTFLKISTSTGAVKKAVYKEKRARQRTASGALFSKELSMFTSSANYMLNCGLGILLIPACGIFMAIMGKDLVDASQQFFASRPGGLTIVLLAAMFVVMSMNDMAAPSVSLDKDRFWIAQSLPVSCLQVLKSKVLLQVLLTGIPMALCAVLTATILPDGTAAKLLFVAASLLGVVLLALFDLFLGLKMPNLHWTSESTPMKQSLSVTIALFGGWVLGAAVAVLYFWQGFKLGPVPCMAIFCALEIVLILMLYLWMRKKGTAIYAAL